MRSLILTSVAVAALFAAPGLVSAQAPGPGGEHASGGGEHGPGAGDRSGGTERHEQSAPAPGARPEAAPAAGDRKAQAEPKAGTDAEKTKPGEEREKTQKAGAADKHDAESDKARGEKNAAGKDDAGTRRDKTGAADHAGGARGNAKSVKITSEQQTKIRTSIRNTHVENISHVDFSISVGAVVPERYHWHPLPPEIIEYVPEYRGYDFIEVENEILIIDPGTGEIVYVIS